MATYYSTSNDQKDYLPNSYPQTPFLPGNMLMYNYPSSSIEIASNSIEHPHQEMLSNLGGSRISPHEMLLMNHNNLMGGGAGSTHLQGQGLSLSLGSQMSIQFQNPDSGLTPFFDPSPSHNYTDRNQRNSEYLLNGFHGSNHEQGKSDSSLYGTSTISNSKYLKATQQLLDEVINVKGALKKPDFEKNKKKNCKNNDGLENENSSNGQDSAGKSSCELSSTEKTELQNKMTKLLSMLDEVDRRYKQYYHQMQIVVSSFDIISGPNASKPYTALAFQTISRHFRSLRDAITDQISLTRKSLGKQDSLANNGKGVGISRLRYVDQQLKQQRAFQQFGGVMQQHAWRPQRGLPENSVTVLRAWLFEHFLHPYPKDSDKIMLARQTGLTRNQVSNWFINARVRLWKPMVEEMYKEEAGDADIDSNSSSENAPKPTQNLIKTANNLQPQIDMEEDSSLFSNGIVQSDDPFYMSELARFGRGDRVSLTLGLETGDFDCIDPANVQHRFSSSHLLHDFVA